MTDAGVASRARDGRPACRSARPVARGDECTSGHSGGIATAARRPTRGPRSTGADPRPDAAPGPPQPHHEGVAGTGEGRAARPSQQVASHGLQCGDGRRFSSRPALGDTSRWVRRGLARGAVGLRRGHCVGRCL
eukprot:scaffold20067_cov107-Isochrysis_galbana.AAC.2